MQTIVIFCDENDEKDKLSINDDNFSDDNEFSVDFNKFYGDDNFSGDYFGNGDIRIANANNTEIPYIPSSLAVMVLQILVS